MTCKYSEMNKRLRVFQDVFDFYFFPCLFMEDRFGGVVDCTTGLQLINLCDVCIKI